MLPYPMTSAGGIDNFTTFLIRELAALVDLVVWVLFDTNRQLEASVPQSERVIIELLKRGISGRMLIPFSRWENPDKFRFWLKLLFEHQLNSLIRKHGITHCLIVSPQDLPALRLPVPITAVVHDRNWHVFPENFLFFAPAFMDTIIKGWFGVAKTIITPSRTVQREMSELCPEYCSKIRVVPEASTVLEHHNSLSGGEAGETDATPIFYYPSAARAHKGHLTLFRAAHKLGAAGHRFKVMLTGWETRLLTGYEPWRVPQVEKCRTFYLGHKNVLEGRVEALDYCERERVENLYRICRRVVLPSQYEGFGLPLIEAVARRCRVICSDIEPFREQLERHKCADYVQVFP